MQSPKSKVQSLKSDIDLVEHNRLAYNTIARHFSATRNRVWPEFKEFSAYLRNGQRILDWGCGNGRLLGFIQNFSRLEYWGIDQSAELLKQARRLNKPAIADGQAHFFSNANKEKIFPACYFDIVFMVASFFHLPDETSRLALLKKTFNELKPGGRLIMVLWNLGSTWAAKKKKDWKELSENDWLIPWKNPAGDVLADRYYHHFTPSEITRLLTTRGFSVEKLHYSEAVWSDDRGGRNMIVIAKKV